MESFKFATDNNLHVGSCPNYMFLYNEIFVEQDYDISRYFPKFAIKSGIVFDVGANSGLASLYFVKKYNGIKELHCFEPIPQIYKQLQHNLKQCDEKFVLNNVALGNRNSITDIIYFPLCDGLSTQSNIHEKIVLRSWWERIVLNMSTIKQETITNVPVITLSQYIKDHNITSIDLIKIDVEGAEYEIMLGIDNELLKVKYFIIEVEAFKPHLWKGIKKLLSKHYKMKCTRKDNWRIIYAERI
jgi:FkbM family methyltransferase